MENDVDCHDDALSGWACVALFGGGEAAEALDVLLVSVKRLGVVVSALTPGTIPPRLDSSGGLLSTINLYIYPLPTRSPPPVCIIDEKGIDNSSRESRQQPKIKK